MKAGTQEDGHGFGLVDPVERCASNGSAGYYSLSPTPGLRMIALDTLSEGGMIVALNGSPTKATSTTRSSSGCDGPLKKATAADELVVHLQPPCDLEPDRGRAGRDRAAVLLRRPPPTSSSRAVTSTPVPRCRSTSGPT